MAAGGEARAAAATGAAAVSSTPSAITTHGSAVSSSTLQLASPKKSVSADYRKLISVAEVFADKPFAQTFQPFVLCTHTVHMSIETPTSMSKHLRLHATH